ncbi:MAG: hypothetical protein ACYDG2_21965 [Ruminiclostridium sp.]
MWKIFNRKKTHELDIKVLFKNDIPLLIIDERWNGLFNNNIIKTSSIIDDENKIKELLKEQSRLITESKEIIIKKKECLDDIIKQTTEAFENNNMDAKARMQDCEKTIVAINKRTIEIEQRLSDIPNDIRRANLELLEKTIKLVYFSIKENQLRVIELDKEIEQAREQIKKLIDEKGLLAQDDTDTYSYFHDILGGTQLQKLDEIYFEKIK